MSEALRAGESLQCRCCVQGKRPEESAQLSLTVAQVCCPLSNISFTERLVCVTHIMDHVFSCQGCYISCGIQAE